jgi:YceI-like domain
MIFHRTRIVLFTVAAAIVLVSCAVRSPVLQADVAPVAHGSKQADLKAVYSDLAVAGGKVFTLNPKTSTVRIYAFRGGRAAKMGHNHVLSAPQFTGLLYLVPSGASGSRFDLEFRLDELEFDKPEYRSPLGNAFPAVLPPEAIKGAHDHMLGEDNLQADRFPFVRIHSLQISGESPKFAAKAEIEVHGQKREMWIPLTVEGLPDRLSVTGAFVLRQTDFGAQPYTVLGGLLAMQDEVVIEFHLIGS